MAYDGWLQFGDVELVNLSRTAQLADSLGIDTLWFGPDEVQWIEDALGGTGYEDITEAPWYDPTYTPSTEFAGIVSLRVPALDESTRTSDPVEYITDGGSLGLARSPMLPIVVSAVIVASTDRGAEFGKRWMDRTLRESKDRTFCTGSDLRYFRSETAGSAIAHRRNVGLTRAATVTRKSSSDCAAMWWVNFTLTAGDSYEYGEEVEVMTGLGGTPTGDVLGTGELSLLETPCPQFDYTPLYDPLYPALVAPPAAPTFYPDGWNLPEGATFLRQWVRVEPLAPRTLGSVPVLTITTQTEARMVRVSIWPSDSVVSDQCDPLFTAIISYLPPGYQFVIDGEQQACYVWDGVSPTVRRVDSLVYGEDANPLDWAVVSDPENLLVTLDVFSYSGGAGQIRAALSLVSKSD